MLVEIIQQNFIALVVILFLIMFIMTNSNFDKKTNRLFLASALCLLVLVIEETWEVQMAQEPTYSSLRVLLSAIGYTLRPTTVFFLVMIIDKSITKRLSMLAIPIIVNAFISFSALFGDWSFSYTVNNEFVRGPLGMTPFIVGGFYIIVLLYRTIRDSRKGGATETMTLVAIGLLTLIATIMESVFDFRGIQCACGGISIVFFYLFLHTNQNNRDPLTGALTRRKFYLDAAKYNNTLSAVISLDLNDLKKINDNYGHLEGDKALLTITTIIKKHMNKRRALYRTGGDEFMILCYRMSEQEVKDLIKIIQTDIDSTQYRCAIGYALHNDKGELDSTCQEADDEMYKNKLVMKGQLQKIRCF